MNQTAQVVTAQDMLSALAGLNRITGNREVSLLHPRIDPNTGRRYMKEEYRPSTAWGFRGQHKRDAVPFAEKEAASEAMCSALEDSDGIEKIAKDLHSPVLSHLDYESIAYNLLDTEQYKPAVPMIKHTDLHRGDWRKLDLPALFVNDEGNTNEIRMFRSVLELKPFDVKLNLFVRYADLSETMYDIIGRLKDRLAIAFALLFDLRYLSLLHNCSQLYNTEQDTALPATRPFLARLFNQVERHRLPVTSLVGGTELTQSIRMLNVWEVGFDTLAEINGEGYLANIFGVNIWITNKITPVSNVAPAYAVSAPKFHGFRGIRQSLLIQMANDIKRGVIIVGGYERYSMALWNILSCAYGTYATDADPNWYGA
jgi:hypothetical protein